jgi:hypothetical protein
MDNARPPRQLSNDEVQLLLGVLLPILGDALAGDLSDHATRKLSKLFSEYPLLLPETFEWGTHLPRDPVHRTVIAGLERVVHRLRYASGEDVAPGLADPLC